MLLALIFTGGDIPDPDRNAHDMWAKQLFETGSLTISSSGITDDWTIYYPNTVPKPLELAASFLRLPGGLLYHSLLTVLAALLVTAAANRAAGGGETGMWTGLYLGLNPAFIFLCLRGNPAIPFIGSVFLLGTLKGSGTGILLSSLSRPEGFIYSGWHVVRRRKWKMLALIAVSATVWLIFHKTACGSFFWTSREVKYSVAAMAYPTPNPLTLYPWAFLRSILILGAPAAAILYSSIKRWEHKVPFAVNFVLLGISLALGSLVLPRYIDQLFLLAVPFVFQEIFRHFRGRTRRTVLALVLVLPGFQWISALPEIIEYTEVREIYTEVELPSEGITATNELLIPGIALANGISDPREMFVSSDRAAWEGASGEDLVEHGVKQIIVVPVGVYFPEHTGIWLQELETTEDIEVNYFQ